MVPPKLIEQFTQLRAGIADHVCGDVARQVSYDGGPPERARTINPAPGLFPVSGKEAVGLARSRSIADTKVAKKLGLKNAMPR